jgi:hypothetical protein
MSRIPPLPTPHHHGGTYESSPFQYYTADQLLARDRQIVEACAQVAESFVDAEWPNDDQSVQASSIAAALRSLLGEGEEH